MQRKHSIHWKSSLSGWWTKWNVLYLSRWYVSLHYLIRQWDRTECAVWAKKDFIPLEPIFVTIVAILKFISHIQCLMKCWTLCGAHEMRCFVSYAHCSERSHITFRHNMIALAVHHEMWYVTWHVPRYVICMQTHEHTQTHTDTHIIEYDFHVCACMTECIEFFDYMYNIHDISQGPKSDVLCLKCSVYDACCASHRLFHTMLSCKSSLVEYYLRNIWNIMFHMSCAMNLDSVVHLHRVSCFLWDPGTEVVHDQVSRPVDHSLLEDRDRARASRFGEPARVSGKPTPLSF